MELLILEEYMNSEFLKLSRKATLQEEHLIEFLIKKGGVNMSINWKDSLLVSQMEDGQMGGLYLYPNGIEEPDRVFGTLVSDLQFNDSDGIEVLVSLYIDTKGNLFELDIWKTNFDHLIELPASW